MLEEALGFALSPDGPMEREIRRLHTQIRGYEIAFELILKELGLPEGSQDAIQAIRKLKKA